MRTLVVAAALAVAFGTMGYVRRSYTPAQRATVVAEGSRDRTLPGKARIKARRA